MEDQTKANIEHALKWGLILGMTDIMIPLLAYIIDKSLMVNTWVSISTFVINVILLIFSITTKRKELGGLISFNEAFIICFIVFLGSAIMQNIFNYVLYNLIDPGLSEFIKQRAIEATSSMMEKFGADQDGIDKALEKLQNEDFSQTPARVGKQFFFMMIYGAILSSILAAIFKRNPRVTDFE